LKREKDKGGEEWEGGGGFYPSTMEGVLVLSVVAHIRGIHSSVHNMRGFQGAGSEYLEIVSQRIYGTLTDSLT
jgi:hypothetical protein